MRRLAHVAGIIALLALTGTMAHLAMYREPPYPIYVELSLVEVPVVRNGTVTGRAHLTFALEVADEETAARVRRRLPLLVSEALRKAYDTLGGGALPADGSFDLAHMRAQVRFLSDRIFGSGVVRQVLLLHVRRFSAETSG